MQPEEERPIAFLQPLDREVRGVLRAPLHGAGVHEAALGHGRALVRWLEVRVEELETLVETEVLGHRKSAHERRGVVALITEDLGQGHLRLVEAVLRDAVHHAQPVPERILPGEDRRVRHGGHGGLADRAGEDGALFGQPVDPGAGLGRVPVAAEVVGASGVHRDQEHGGARRARAAAARQDGGGGEEEEAYPGSQPCCHRGARHAN